MSTAPSRRLVDVRVHLLSRQVLDVHGEPVTTVDDIELVACACAPDADADADADDDADARGDSDADGARVGQPTQVAALLTGPVLVTRILGGRPPRSRWERIPWELVVRLGAGVTLRASQEQLDLGWTERWLRRHVIAHIPGGQHDAQEEP